MATGICYTWSGDKKIYESILGPKLGVYRGDDFGPITSDAFTLSLMPSNAMCMYEIKVKGDEYILSENNPTDYLVVKYGGVDKMFGFKKKDKVTIINVTGNISVSGGTSYYAYARANISVPCDVTVKILYTKIKNGMSDDLSVNLTINKNSAEATKLIGKTSDIGRIILNSVTGSPATFGRDYTFNYSKV